MSTTRIVLISLILLPFVVVSVAEKVLAQAAKKEKGDAVGKESEKRSDATDKKSGQPDSIAAASGCCGFSVVFMVIAGIIGVGVYLAPSAIAVWRGCPNAAPILVVNIFLGWSLIGWVVALAWSLAAFEDDNRRYRRRRP
jgi:hypothetical protein